MDFNEDEIKLLKMISDLKPYDVMKIAIDPWGKKMSVNVQNNKSTYEEFNITERLLKLVDLTKSS